MKRRSSIALIAAYLAVLILPVALTVAGVTQFVSGALPPDRRPAVRLGAILDESFQRGTTRWLENHRRLFGFPVYVDNSALYHLFGETRVGARVRLGRDPRVLFVDEDVEYLDLREHNLPTADAVDALAARIASVQARLRARGQALVPVIAPAKTSVYRDQVDPRWLRFAGRTPSDVEVYDRLTAALTAHGVAFVDMRAGLTRGAHPRAEVWAPTARHWSDFAACLTLAEVVGVRARLLDRPPTPYPCVLGHRRADRRHDDFDLWRILNVWGARPPTFDVPFAIHAPPAAGEARTAALFVGTSFNLALVRDAAASERFGAIHLHWYDSRMIAWPEDVSVPTAAGAPAWRDQLVDSDLIVLDLMEAALYSGHVYVDNFLTESLRAAPTLPRWQ